MRRFIFCLLIASSFLFLLLPSQATAIQNANAKIAGHLRVHAAKGSPCTSPPVPSCNFGEASLMEAGLTGVGYDLYLLVVDGNPAVGVAGASFGISYGPNLAVGSWSLCADLNFPGGPTGVSWPESGSGNVVTWRSDTNCQDTPAPGDTNGDVTAVIGALYVYAYGDDVFEITRREYVPSPDFQVVDCSSGVSNLVFPQNAGKVGFGTTEGYDPCEGSDPGGGGDSLSYVAQQIIVEFAEGVLSDAEAENSYVGPRSLDAYSFGRPEARTLLQGARATTLEPLFPGFSRTHRMSDGSTVTLPRDVSRFYRVALDSRTDPISLARTLRQHEEDFASVTPDYLLETSYTPDDPKFTQQWWLNNAGQFGGDGVTDVEGPEAWDRLIGEASTVVPVGVLDTGIDLDHSDLNVLAGPNFYSGGDSDDLSGHGTSVAGIIGAIGDNSFLGAGVNWSAQTVALKVGTGSTISSSSAAQAVAWAISNNLPVINMSFGGPGSEAHLAQAKNANAIGMLQVAAMGNANSSTPHYPAAWGNFVTAVGALYLDGTRWTDAAINNAFFCSWPQLGSNSGSWIDFATPGGRSIATTGLDDGFLDVVSNCTGGFGGTSAAAPMLSGIASLLLSVRPNLSGEDIYEVLKRTAHDLDVPGHDINTGWGRPDGDAALEYVLTKQFQFGVAASPQTHSVTGRTMSFYNLPDYIHGGTYGPGLFDVDEYELRATVTFPQGFANAPDVWGKALGGHGWSTDNPRDIDKMPESYAEVVAGTETATSVELRTYVYWVKTRLPLNDPILHWYPTSPQNALLAWTAAGQPTSVGVEEDGGVIEFASRVLENPARGQATMAFSLPERGPVVIEVFDIAGRRVREVANGDLPEGAHLARWNGQSDQGARVPSGVYFFRVRTDSGNRAEKFVYTQ